MDEFNYITACTVFLVYVIIDCLYAAYVISVSRGQALLAATCTSIIYSLLAFGVLSYSKNVWYIVPLASGAFLGTFITVKFRNYLPKEHE
jgi:presenilin-like A22 family membrane protease